MTRCRIAGELDGEDDVAGDPLLGVFRGEDDPLGGDGGELTGHAETGAAHGGVDVVAEVDDAIGADLFG